MSPDGFDMFGDRTRAIWRRGLQCGFRYGLAVGFMGGALVGFAISYGW
jgi:hypothetical protein